LFKHTQISIQTHDQRKEDCLNAKVTLYFRDGHLGARGPYMAHHSVFSVARKHSENIFKSEISYNFSQ